MPGKVVTREEWDHARLNLLKQEKEVTRKMDELARLRADLPITKVSSAYTFTGPSGEISLVDMFAGRKQLIIYHIMFDPAWDGACKSCSFLIDQLPQHLEVLHARDTELVLVSRAPYEKLENFKQRMGWTIPWFSSYGSNFNDDFHATQDGGEVPGLSVLIRGGTVEDGEDDGVYHAYSTYSRGLDNLLTTYSLLDMTPLGRQDEGRQPGGGVYRDEM